MTKKIRKSKNEKNTYARKNGKMGVFIKTWHTVHECLAFGYIKRAVYIYICTGPLRIKKLGHWPRLDFLFEEGCVPH